MATLLQDKLFYYSKSKDARVGRGANEYVFDKSTYTRLGEIKDWRQILSNFYVEPFTFKGKNYNTVEHAFQCEKIKIANPAKAHYFTLDSDHEIGKGDGSIAQKNRKLVKLNDEQIKFWNKNKDSIMIDITRERIRQSDRYRTTLLATLNSELWHIRPRKPAIRNKYLEELREEFKLQLNY
jgi:predicted NAD-dependent protein-ADP-ribosyltransferase YbiA (DUF1768 family)